MALIKCPNVARRFQVWQLNVCRCNALLTAESEGFAYCVDLKNWSGDTFISCFSVARKYLIMVVNYWVCPIGNPNTVSFPLQNISVIR